MLTMKFVLFSAASSILADQGAVFWRLWGFAETPGTSPCGFIVRGGRKEYSRSFNVTFEMYRSL